MSTEAKVVKRKPGRPRKKPLKETPSKKGILQNPSRSENLVELMYDKPSNFKKLCQFWKSLSAEKVAFQFTPDRLIMHTKNHKENTTVKTKVLGAKVLSYYCPTIVPVVVLFNNLDIILQKLDKVYESISFVIQIVNKDRTMHIILQNEYDIPEYFDIDIVHDPVFIKQFEGTLDDTVPYPLQFKLPGKYFKKAIADIKNFEDQWTIEKYGADGNLMFTYRSVNGQVKARNVPKDLKKVIEVNELSKEELFTVSIFASNLKPTSAAQLADFIHFKAAKDKPLWIWADLDEGAIFVDVLVNIVDYKTLKTPTTKAETKEP